MDVALVPFDRSHRPGLVEMVGDPHVLRFTRVPDPPPADFVDFWIDMNEAGRREGTRETFVIVEPGSQRFLGIAVAPRISREERTAELGYLVHPDARGQGVATRALALLTAWAFQELGALRLELLISVDNDASKRVALKNGYVFEGTLRSLYFKQDRREDCEIWSRLPSDPAPEGEIPK